MASPHTHTHADTHTHTHMQTHTHTNTHTHTHTHTYTYTCTCTCTHTYIYTHTYTHTQSSTIMPTKDSAATCPILERVLNGAPAGISLDLLKTYQTLILHSIMDYLQTGNEDVMITFKGSHFTGTIENSLRCVITTLSGFNVIVWGKIFVQLML